MPTLTKRTALLAITLALVVGQAGAQSNRRDGTWWRGLSHDHKSAYVLGLLDGQHLGLNLAVEGLETQDRVRGIATLEAAYDSSFDRYLKDVTNGQLVDGLDAFYGDARNRTIPVINSIWVVLNRIDGTPEAEIEALVDGLRRSRD